MNYLVTYPKIKGANDIVGWVSSQHTKVNLKVGESTILNEDTAISLKKVYPFLEIKEGAEKIVKDTKKTVKEIERRIKDKEAKEEKSGEWSEMRKKLVELGLFKVGMTKEEAKTILKKHKNA